MKTIVINADPKRRGHTAQLMKKASEGAESVGAEVNMWTCTGLICPAAGYA